MLRDHPERTILPIKNIHASRIWISLIGLLSDSGSNLLALNYHMGNAGQISRQQFKIQSLFNPIARICHIHYRHEICTFMHDQLTCQFYIIPGNHNRCIRDRQIHIHTAIAALHHHFKQSWLVKPIRHPHRHICRIGIKLNR